MAAAGKIARPTLKRVNPTVCRHSGYVSSLSDFAYTDSRYANYFAGFSATISGDGPGCRYRCSHS